MLLWLGFVICTGAIIYSGTGLSKYGDIIAEKTGLGRAWIGIVLMASVTSLPELVTGISSVTYADVPDIAVGDVLGTCVFNMLTFTLLDALHKSMPISTKAHQGHVLSAAFGILLLSTVCLGIFLRGSMPPVGWLGPSSILFIVIYLVAMRMVFSYEKRKISELLKEIAEELRYKEISMKAAILHFGINAIIVIIAATFLPKIGEGIAVSTGLGQTFVGNIFIAVSTSLPEVVVSIAAVKMGAVDLAIGNLFGSNVFNIFILALDDIFFLKGPLLSYASPNHIISALSAIAMTTVAIIGLTYRAEKKKLFVAWDSLGIIVIYAANLVLLYVLK